MKEMDILTFHVTLVYLAAFSFRPITSQIQRSAEVALKLGNAKRFTSIHNLLRIHYYIRFIFHVSFIPIT